MNKILKISRFGLMVFFLFPCLKIEAQWAKLDNQLFQKLNGTITLAAKEDVVWAFARQTAGGLQSSIFLVSEDYGENWRNAFPVSMQNYRLSDLTLINRDSSIVVLSDSTNHEHHMLLSPDRANTWIEIPLPSKSLSFPPPSNIIKCKKSVDIYFQIPYFSEVNRSQSYRSSDMGLSWSKTLDSISYLISKVVAPNGNIFGIGRDTSFVERDNILPIYRSSDDGRTWTLREKMKKRILEQHGLVVDSTTLYTYYDDEFYTSNFVDSESGVVFFSSNEGVDWDSTTVYTVDGGVGSDDMSQSEHAVYASTPFGIKRSADHGVTWENIGGPAVPDETQGLCAPNDCVIMAFDVDRILWRTMNAGGHPINQLPPNSVKMSTQNFSVRDTPGVIVNVPIIVKKKGNLSSLSLILHYDTIYLKYQGSKCITGRVCDLSNEEWPGRTKLQFNASELTDTLIGFAVFKFYPSEITATKINFDSLQAILAGACESSINLYQDSSATTVISNSGTRSVNSYSNIDLFQSVKLFPNPANEFLTIVSNEDIADVKIEIIDLLGNIKKTSALQLHSGVQIAVDLNSLSKGKYFLRMSKSNGKMTFPFIKTN